MDEDLYKQFQNEIYIHSQLEHSSIVTFYGVCVTPYSIVLEYISGGDLNEFLYHSSTNHDNFSFHQKMKHRLIQEGPGSVHGRFV